MILTVGLELRVIGPDIFTAMVLMAVVTTLMATPLLGLVDRTRAEVSARTTTIGPPPIPTTRTGRS